MNMEMKPLALIVEDEEIILNFISTVLTSNEYRVVKASTGRDALSMAASHAPDVILLDLGLPDMDGNTGAARSARAEQDSGRRGIGRAGTSRKKWRRSTSEPTIISSSRLALRSFLARIRTALRHSLASFSPASGQGDKTVVGQLEIDYEKRLVTLDGQKVHLTPIEYKILALLSRNAGKVLTHDFIIREIWGAQTDEGHALRVNMANIRRKIEKNPGMPRYILTEVGVGYRMADD